MNSLHNQFCTWVQVHHLYQPKQNLLVNAFVRHHIAVCKECSVEIASLEKLGHSIGSLDFDPEIVSSDVSWARLAAVIPVRDSGVSYAGEQLPKKSGRTLPRVVALSTCAFACVGFAAIMFQSYRSQPSIPPHVVTTVQADLPVTGNSADTAVSDLSRIRDQAKMVARTNEASSDPFSKQSVNSFQNEQILAKQPNMRAQVRSRKPLITTAEILATKVDRPSIYMAQKPSIVDVNQSSLAQPPVMALRSMNNAVTSDQNVASALSANVADIADTSASYLPSAALELTESQNRLRSLLQ